MALLVSVLHLAKDFSIIVLELSLFMAKMAMSAKEAWSLFVRIVKICILWFILDLLTHLSKCRTNYYMCYPTVIKFLPADIFWYLLPIFFALLVLKIVYHFYLVSSNLEILEHIVDDLEVPLSGVFSINNIQEERPELGGEGDHGVSRQFEYQLPQIPSKIEE